ncbi:MAG TPA: ABC transporter permease [Burkholderiaceae bacterium]|nr:ABC transporter permease [Burkholderiaceae bacterium]
MRYGSPLLALALTAAFGALLFVALGRDPLSGLQVFLIAPLESARGWSEVGLKMTPLLLASVGLAICYRANVWNIGAEGQLVAGAIAAGGVALLATPESPRAFVLAVLAAGAAGGLAWAAITALLRDRFHANEILVSLMLTYIAQLWLLYLVHGPWRDPMGFSFPYSRQFEAAALVPLIAPPTRLHAGLLIAFAAALAAWLYLARSRSGFALQVAGAAPAAARFAGFSWRRGLWISLAASGALAGLAGALEVAGPIGQLTPNVSPGYGFAAIIVAWLGRLHPIGCVLAAFAMALVYIGGELSQSRLGLPHAITGVFQGMLLLTLLACDTLVHYRIRRS